MKGQQHRKVDNNPEIKPFWVVVLSFSGCCPLSGLLSPDFWVVVVFSGLLSLHFCGVVPFLCCCPLISGLLSTFLGCCPLFLGGCPVRFKLLIITRAMSDEEDFLHGFDDPVFGRIREAFGGKP